MEIVFKKTGSKYTEQVSFAKHLFSSQRKEHKKTTIKKKNKSANLKIRSLIFKWR